MTCHHWDGKVGYKGQKYAVAGDKEDGTMQVIGWQNADELDAGWEQLAQHFRLKNLRLEVIEQRIMTA
jgi:hypothetical protein